MKIPSKTWQRFIKSLAKINTSAAGDVVQYMINHDVSTYEGTKALIDYAYAVSTKYGEAAAELSCQMYDAIATASKAAVPAAEPAATATYGEIAKTIYGTMASTKEPEAVGAAVGRSVKLASVDTLQQNALRDGAEWAWIPSGDSCAYCMMLASRGWVKASKKAIKNGHAEHVHNNCDCAYCVRFDNSTIVEGYDPDALYEEWESAGNTSKERLNALRRQFYAENKDYINAQKRAAYARRKNVDNGGGSGYNNSPAKKSIAELEKTYEKAVNDGWISPLCGFDNYTEQYNRMWNEVIGSTTVDGKPVYGMTDHFMERLIGTGRDPKIYTEDHMIVKRSGVSVDDVKQALLNGEARTPVKDSETGLRSQKYKGDNCIVTINPDTHKLIQCNPRKKKK